MKLEFYGAAGGVTGSHSVLDVDGFRVGVDAGLFQGSDARRGQTDFGHDPRALEALLLTHAHSTTAAGYLCWPKRNFAARSIPHPLPPTCAKSCSGTQHV